MGHSLKYPFLTVTQVIHYYHHNKRGRQKAIDVLEQEIRASPMKTDIRWEVCCLAVARGTKYAEPAHVRAFELRYFGDYPDRMTITDLIEGIAREFRVSRSTVYDWLDNIKADIEHEAKELELIPE